VSKPKRHRKRARVETQMDANHLRREARTALELAILALAPSELVDRLAVATGLLEAMGELPPDSAPALALLPKTVERARRVIADWQEWEAAHVHKGLA
jgi:hypothetical protein